MEKGEGEGEKKVGGQAAQTKTVINRETATEW